MIVMDPYNPLIHLKAIKNLFRSTPEQEEKSDETNEVPENSASSENDAVSKIDFTSILQDMATLVTDYDLYITQFKDDATISLIKYLQNSIVDLMIKYGAEEFTDTEYHSLSDIVVPFHIIEERTPIKSTLRPGIKYNSIVLLRSRVEVEDNP